MVGVLLLGDDGGKSLAGVVVVEVCGVRLEESIGNVLQQRGLVLGWVGQREEESQCLRRNSFETKGLALQALGEGRQGKRKGKECECRGDLNLATYLESSP